MASKRKLLLLSTSTVFGSEYLQYAKTEIDSFFKRNNVAKILFIPFALRNHDEYARKVKDALSVWGYEVKSIHESSSYVEEVNNAQAFFIGGGNTFLLLKTLYDHSLIEPIRKRVLHDGIPYMGSSAGTNVATISICTTNDMPIVHVPSLNALALVPFNVNPHYMDPTPGSKHMGETRETRINQYHEIPGMPPVVGLREGSILEVIGDKVKLLGDLSGRVFIEGELTKEYPADSDLSFLLNKTN
ncbi:alpha-aspartyl dipeptidase [Ischnura elegans]|uniref:alpha-aspartyl dipeptidase n=1 Tax=Ischnura elegans TaxID=197161 RepID=UPI001ED87B47|nr:alpha-aspartyl dipeptidase [Ischnura elegans]